MSDILNISGRAKAEKAMEEQELEQLRSDIKEISGSKAGLRVLAWILDLSSLYEITFTGDHRTYYFEGRRSVGLEILEMLTETDKRIYLKILGEINNGG